MHYFSKHQERNAPIEHGKVPDTKGHVHLVLVPPEKRTELLKNPEQLIWLTDFMVSDRPNVEELDYLTDFLRDDYDFAPQKCYWPPRAVHVKVGYDETGLYINKDHLRRYAVTEPLNIGSGYPTPSSMREQEKMLAVDNETATALRDKLLQQTFSVADKNCDGLVDKAELRLLLRRVAPSLGNAESDKLFREMDKDGSGTITSGEFSSWLKTSAASTFTGALQEQVLSHKAFVKAAFRLWDVNGDGSISRSELVQTMRHVCPKMQEEQFDSLFSEMDADGDNRVDYHEFVNFLWAGA